MTIAMPVVHVGTASIAVEMAELVESAMGKAVRTLAYIFWAGSP